MTRQELAESIADTISDYREGQISQPDAAHLLRWVNQFDKEVRDPILEELNHALPRTYFSRTDCNDFLKSVITTESLVGSSPEAFWKKANILRIQQKGESQRVILEMFDRVLEEETGLRITNCGSSDGPNFYFDDCLFTATHVRWDLIKWVKEAAPKNAAVNVVTAARHKGRVDYTGRKVIEEATALNKSIKLTWWWQRDFADTSAGGDTECLHPWSYPDDDRHVQKLLKTLEEKGQPARTRTTRTTSANQVFSGEAGREVLEQEFLKTGARIKYELCPLLTDNQWPLGYDIFKGAGFGSLVVTFRNCPNNCPLALWAGDPWYPLFPRKVN